jgi:hypothetical protein
MFYEATTKSERVKPNKLLQRTASPPAELIR